MPAEGHGTQEESETLNHWLSTDFAAIAAGAGRRFARLLESYRGFLDVQNMRINYGLQTWVALLTLLAVFAATAALIKDPPTWLWRLNLPFGIGILAIGALVVLYTLMPLLQLRFSPRRPLKRRTSHKRPPVTSSGQTNTWWIGP